MPCGGAGPVVREPAVAGCPARLPVSAQLMALAAKANLAMWGRRTYAANAASMCATLRARRTYWTRQFPCEISEIRGLDTGRIAMKPAPQGWHVDKADTPNARHLQRGKADPCYMSMVLRINPTARPSISKGSPGCTTITGKSGFSGTSSMAVAVRRRRLTVTSSPRRATMI